MVDIEECLRRRRMQCILHRILYYVFDEPIISDNLYTYWENQLKKMCAEYPDIERQVKYAEYCPSRCLGSSDRNSYPKEMLRLAADMLEYNKKRGA